MSQTQTSSNSNNGLSTGTKVAAAIGVAAAAAAGVVAFGRNGENRTAIHVQPNGEGWEVMVDGNKQATRVFEVKDDAVTFARELAHERTPSELIIHRGDGSEQNRHRYES